MLHSVVGTTLQTGVCAVHLVLVEASSFQHIGSLFFPVSR